ncbi:MAG: hypothetical protein LLG04_11735 [Parachlamydia sp.]|nr:hypothetical protein [Parachlamydia sp.]
MHNSGFDPHAPRAPQASGFNPHAQRAEQSVLPPATYKAAALASPVIGSGPYQAQAPHAREQINRNAEKHRK